MRLQYDAAHNLHYKRERRALTSCMLLAWFAVAALDGVRASALARAMSQLDKAVRAAARPPAPNLAAQHCTATPKHRTNGNAKQPTVLHTVVQYMNNKFNTNNSNC